MIRARCWCGSAAALAALAAAANAQSWDATADYSIDRGNPNGAWSYGWMPVGFGELHLLSNHGYVYGNPLWGGWAGDHTPSVWQNLGPPREGVETGEIALHPGPGTEPCVIRWTSPLHATVGVKGRFEPGNWGVMNVAVRTSEATVWSAVDSGAFDLSLEVAPGATIDFAVYGGYGAGATPLEVVISVGPPCPADFNQDGGIDGADVEAFFYAWEAGLGAGDVNADGGVDGADVEAFFAVWEAGGC